MAGAILSSLTSLQSYSSTLPTSHLVGVGVALTEPEWIKMAERMVWNEYSRTYEGRVKTSEATASAHDVDALVILCDSFLARNCSN